MLARSSEGEERLVSEIEVRCTEQGEHRSRFEVQVSDPDGSIGYEVTLSRSDRARLAAGYPSPEAFVTACFGFLLEREPKESILRTFDVSQISTYFPEFESTISRSAG
jgi:hypothetical protein